MTNVLLILIIGLGIINLYLWNLIRRYIKKLEWTKKTYDRNFNLTHSILNSINEKIKNDSKFMLQDTGATRFWNPDEFQEVFERVQNVKDILTNSMKTPEK